MLYFSRWVVQMYSSTELHFRYKDAERLHTSHYNFALTRGDIHGLAIACGNIGFLKFYNPEESDDALVYQFIEYALAEQVGDCARMGVAFNKIGKLYTTLGYDILVFGKSL